MALQHYEMAKGKLPRPYIADANGKPMHSWRVLLLPFLGRDDLFQRYNLSEPWDGPNNRKLHSEIIKIYSCPCCEGKQPATETNYVLVVGPETMWQPGQRMTVGEVIQADGAANTVMIVEAHGTGIHWMEPRDIDFSTMSMTVNPLKGVGISSRHPYGSGRGIGANVVFADGHTQWLENDTPPEAVRAMLTIDGGEKVEVP
jgi:prepilin-type processing-associated H-X9-DG protein